MHHFAVFVPIVSCIFFCLSFVPFVRDFNLKHSNVTGCRCLIRYNVVFFVKPYRFFAFSFGFPKPSEFQLFFIIPHVAKTTNTATIFNIFLFYWFLPCGIMFGFILQEIVKCLLKYVFFNIFMFCSRAIRRQQRQTHRRRNVD